MPKMQHVSSKYNIASYLLVCLIPLVIIFGNFRFLIYNLGFYQELYQKTGVYNNITQNLAKDSTNNLFRYFRGKNNLDKTFYSKQAQTHLSEVKTLLFITFGLFYASLSLSLMLVVFLVASKSYGSFLNGLAISSSLTFFVVLALGLGILNFFDPLFYKFHQVIFTNTLWLFPPDDNLIKMFPAQFFQIFANTLATNILVTSAVMLIFSVAAKNYLKCSLKK